MSFSARDSILAPGVPLTSGTRLGGRLGANRIVVRIALVLIAVMLLAQGIGIVFFVGGRTFLGQFESLDGTVARLRAPAEALLATAASDRAAVVRQLSLPGFAIDAVPDFQPKDLIVDLPGFFPLRDRLLADLAATIDQVLIEAPVSARDLGPPLPWSRLDPGLPVTAWLRLRDATWMKVETSAGDLLGPRPPLFGVVPWIGAAISILVVSLLVARRVSASLRRFAAAAERFGRDIGAGPLPENGPAEVRAVVGAFNRMQARLKRFVADRTQMLAAMSHDLMTPISRLRLRSEALPPGEGRDRMLADLRLMERMVAATLDFARDDVAAERRQRLDLASLVQSICHECADLAGQGREVAFSGAGYLEIVAAPVALSRAIRNVVENALKYGGVAEVTLAQTSMAAEIAVADRGPGVPDAELERVFEPFFRLDPARSEEVGGSGLGLAIARNVMRAHGGEITLANRPGGGLCATLTLPLEAPAASC